MWLVEVKSIQENKTYVTKRVTEITNDLQRGPEHWHIRNLMINKCYRCMTNIDISKLKRKQTTYSLCLGQTVYMNSKKTYFENRYSTKLYTFTGT